jgi:hypothetical protein
VSHRCHHCETAWEGDPKIGRQEACVKCGSALHVCLNCRFHDPGKHNQCAEPAAEWVRDKRVANFCLYFEFRSGDGGAGEDARQRRIDEQIKNLFND